MANPFLARLLDTQQRGLQAERERQMRNQGFGNLGFLGQSVQRSFQPLAEMRQREELQKQRQDFEKQKAIDETAAKYNLAYDKEKNRYYREGGYDPLSGKIIPGKRTYVSPAEIQSNIELEKAKKLAGFATDENLRQNKGLLDQKFDEAVRNLQGIYNPKDNSVRIPTGYNNETKQVIYGEPMSLEEAKNLSDQRNLKATEEIKSGVKVDEAKELTKIADESYRQRGYFDLSRDQDRYETITLSQLKEEMLIKEKLARSLGDIELANKYKEFGIELGEGEVTSGGKSLQDLISEKDLTNLNKELEAKNNSKNKSEAQRMGVEYDSQIGFFKRTFSEVDGREQIVPVNLAELEAKVEKVDPQLQILEKQAEITKQQRKDDVQNSIKTYEGKAKVDLNTKQKEALQELGGVIQPDGTVEISEVVMTGPGEFQNVPKRFNSIREVRDYYDNKKFEDKYGKQLAADLKYKKIEQLDPVLQGKYAENAKNLAEAQAKGSAEGRNTVDIENEQRGLIMANLAKGVRSAIKTGENVDLDLINRLVGNTLPKEVKEQLVEGYKFEKDATNVESLVALANNPLISEADRFAILQQVPQSSGGLQGVKGQDNQPLKYTDFARNEKLLNNLLDEGRILDAPPEEREQLMRDSGYTTPAQQKAVLQIAEKKENERLIKEIERNILNAFEIDPEEVGESVGVLERSTKLDKLWEEQLAGNNGKNKRAIEAAGLTKASFLGSVEKIRRNVRAAEAKIQKDRATALYTLSGKGSSSGAAKQNTYDKIFQKEFGEILRKYDGNITDEFIAEIENLRVTIYGSKTGGPSDVTGSSSVAPAQPIKDEIESRLNQQENKQTVEQPSPQVTETVTQPSVDQAASQGEGFINSKVSTPPEAVREVLQDKRPMKEGVLSNALRVIDDVLGGDSLNQKRARDIYNGVSGEMGGEAQMLNTLSGKSKEEVAKILRDNAPKRGGEGYGKDTRIRVPDDTIDKIFEAVKEYDKFVQPVASIDT